MIATVAICCQHVMQYIYFFLKSNVDQKKYGKAGLNFGSSPGASIRLSPPLCTNKLTLYSRLLRCMGGIKIVRLQHPETLAPHYTNKLTLYSRLLRCVMGCRVSWIIICHFFLIHVWLFFCNTEGVHQCQHPAQDGGTDAEEPAARGSFFEPFERANSGSF